MKKVILFVEGATELEFYKSILRYFHSALGHFTDVTVDSYDIKGIGNYKDSALRKYKSISDDNSEYWVFLCIDADIFNIHSKNYNRIPPFKKKDLQNQLLKAGAKKVFYIEAKESIEDWFLYDYTGVLKYLHLPKNTAKPKGSGQEVLKHLFKKANRVYVKGEKVEGFVDQLNIPSIVLHYCSILKVLCSGLNCDCKLICKKHL